MLDEQQCELPTRYKQNILSSEKCHGREINAIFKHNLTRKERRINV